MHPAEYSFRGTNALFTASAIVSGAPTRKTKRVRVETDRQYPVDTSNSLWFTRALASIASGTLRNPRAEEERRERGVVDSRGDK